MTEPDTECPFISIVVPVMNEESNISLLCQRVAAVFSNSMPSASYELIFVDDGSEDNTWPAIETERKKDIHVCGVRLSRNFGQHVAMRAGLERARGTHLIFMDGDLQEPPESIPVFYQTLIQDGVDAVIGLRTYHSEGLLRKFFSDIYSKAFYWLSDVEIPPNATNFRIVTRRMADLLKDCRGPKTFYGGLICWTGLPISYLQIEMHDRLVGQTKYNLKRLIRHAWTGISSFSSFPLHLSSILGLCVASISILFSVIMVAARIVYPDVPAGYTSLISFIGILGGIHLMALGLLGEYMSHIHTVINARPPYVVRKEIISDDDTSSTS